MEKLIWRYREAFGLNRIRRRTQKQSTHKHEHQHAHMNTRQHDHTHRHTRPSTNLSSLVSALAGQTTLIIY